MKKLLTVLLVTGLFMSCMKKEQSSNEIENAEMDAKQAKDDVKEYSKVKPDSVVKDFGEQSSQKDGFEGKKSQY